MTTKYNAGTPRTDAARFSMHDQPLGDWVHADVAEAIEQDAQRYEMNAMSLSDEAAGLAMQLGEAKRELNAANALLREALEDSIDASVSPPEDNMDRDLRHRITAHLEESK